jgi:hypothetical protein
MVCNHRYSTRCAKASIGVNNFKWFLKTYSLVYLEIVIGHFY